MPSSTKTEYKIIRFFHSSAVMELNPFREPLFLGIRPILGGGIMLSTFS